jgi:hypothetical protein
MLQDALYIFKTDEEWIILRKDKFSFKVIDQKGITHCNYNSLKVLTYEQENKLIQLFIHIPTLDRIFFLSTYFPGLEQFAKKLKILIEKSSTSR